MVFYKQFVCRVFVVGLKFIQMKHKKELQILVALSSIFKKTFYRPYKQYCKDWYIAFIIGKLNPKQFPKILNHIFSGGGLLWTIL